MDSKLISTPYGPLSFEPDTGRLTARQADFDGDTRRAQRALDWARTYALPSDPPIRRYPPKRRT